MATTQADIHRYQRIVDGVRQAALSPAAFSTEELSALAGQLAQIARTAAERLQQCVELLRAGQRSEALRLASLPPNLVDLVAALDFPELETWRLLCEHLDLPLPPLLALEQAAELNEAYAAEQPLEQLLRLWRLQAIAAAPLAERLATLRRLVACDPQHSAWREDLLRFEKARLEEMAVALAKVRSQGNMATLAAWLAELNSADWLTPVPKQLMAAVQSAHREAVREAALAELEKLAPRLHEAHAALDEALGRRLREQWNDLLALAPLGPQSPLAEQVAPALEWLADCDQKKARLAAHRRAVAALEKALDRRKPLAELDRLYTEATRHGEALPLEVQRRYQLAREQLLAEAAWRRRLVLVGTTGLVAVLLLGLGFALWQIHTARTLGDHQAAIERLIDERKLREAAEYLQRLKATEPTLARRAPIAALEKRLEGEHAAETQRQKQFAVLATQIETSLDAVPDRAALEQLRKLVRSDAEQHELAALELRVQQRENQLAADQTQRARAELDKLNQQLRQVEGMADPLALRTRLAEIHSQVIRLRQAHAERLGAECDVVVARIQKLEGELEQRLARRQALEGVRQAIGDEELLARRLREFAARHASDPNAGDFSRAAAESHLWKTWHAWNASAEAWNRTPLGRLDVQEAERRLAWLKTWGQWIQRLVPQGADDLPKALSAIANRRSGGRADPASLHALWNDRLVKDIWLVELDDGRRYYTSEAIEREKSARPIPCFVDFNFNERKVHLLPDHVKWAGRAPQAVLADRVRAELRRLPEAGWERAFGGALAAMLAQPDPSSPGIEPLLLGTLLDRTLEVACEGSLPMASVWGDLRRDLAALDIPRGINWLDGKESALRPYRAKVQHLLANLSDVTKRQERALAQAARLDQIRLPALLWAGILVRDGSKWDLLARADLDSLSETTELVCLVPSNESEANPVLLGRLGARQQPIQWADTTRGNWLAGRPVLAVIRTP